MAEVATLGLEVHSDQVKKGAADLDRLTAAAKKAEAAAAGVAAASDKAAKATANITTAAGKARMQWETYDEVVARTGTRIRDAAKASDAATKSVAKQAGAAQEAASKATGYGNAVEQAGRKTERASIASQGFALALGKVKQALAGIALNAISVGVGILLAELAKMVDWGAVAVTALHGLADAIEAVAPYAVGAAAALALIYAPAILAGLGALAVTIWGVVQALGAAALAFVAANPAAAFVIGITAAIAAANIFRDELAQIFGRDIVADANNAVNWVIGAFVGGFNAIKATWSALPAALGDLVISTANAVIGGVEGMINKVAGLIDGFIGKVNSAMKSLPFGMGDDINIATIGEFSLGRLGNPYAGASSAAADAAKGAFGSAMGTDYVGATYDAVAKGASAAADKVRELAGSFSNVESASGQAGKAAGDAAKGATDQWKGLKETVDKSAEAAMKFARDLVGGFVSDLRSGLEQGKGFWRSFGDAALNALNKIVDKLLNDVLDALFQVNSASSGAGGGGGFLGGLLGGIGKIFGFAKGGYTGPGTDSQPAGIVHAGEYVFSKKAVDRIGVGHLDRAHKAAKGYMGGGYVRAYAPANSNLRGYDVGGYVTPAPQYHGNAAVAQGREVIEIVLRDDSGRMADIADQRIQLASGPMLEVSVNQSTSMSRKGLPGASGYYQKRGTI
ncbi:phage tail tape measure protein [Aquamicrobium defluvii]|uniref:Lambda family phage tail tape measure protein n=1 Tax=Aquamicrobium defluvii TaxID=69279 RepID=A0A4R6YER5_9HYPH|nr:phage tail tape measure protein [Aquamicrobium defluvii]TDR34662.1 lambda family phage tail tape measure protein [Aquamicrobium defluvii]